MKLNTKISAKLVDVRGDVCEYSDLIGCSGTLYLSKDNENNWFNPGGSETLIFHRKRTTQKDNLIRISTLAGNTFVFKCKSI
jgi:hypothetical protein